MNTSSVSHLSSKPSSQLSRKSSKHPSKKALAPSSNNQASKQNAKSTTRAQRKQQKQQKLEEQQQQNLDSSTSFEFSKEISMDKITMNLKQTEQALKDYRESLVNTHSKGTLRTADSSSQHSLSANQITNAKFMHQQQQLYQGIPTKVQNEVANIDLERFRQQCKIIEERMSARDQDNSVLNQSSSSRSSSSASSSDQDELILGGEVQLGEINNNDVSISSSKSSSLSNHQKAFDYNQFLQNRNMPASSSSDNKENLQIINNNNYSSISNSFVKAQQLYDQNSNSQAIAGAMRALQRKIKSLEQENGILKECFQGIQKKCVDLERTYQEEQILKEVLEPSKEGQTKEILIQEIEQLSSKFESLKSNQMDSQRLKMKYKEKQSSLKQTIKELQGQMEKQRETFEKQRKTYQSERENLIYEKKHQEQEIKDIKAQSNSKDKSIEQLQNQNSQLQKDLLSTQQQVQQLSSQPQTSSKHLHKLHKYKKQIKSLREELRLLEKSNAVSQKALKHTEQFVDEVVHVNDRLVHSLTKRTQISTQKKNSQRGTTLSVVRMSGDSINMREHHMQQQPVQMYTLQKPPRSTRNIQRCFSFSKQNEERHQFTNQLGKKYQTNNDYHQKMRQLGFSASDQIQPCLSFDNRTPTNVLQHQSVETSRFQEEYQSQGNQQRSLSQRRSSNQIDENFSLQPYEDLINQVSMKIDLIEKDLSQIDPSQYELLQKQRELLGLKQEHEQLIKTIRERSQRQR